VEQCFFEELQKAYKDGFTAEEVAEAKKAVLDARMIGTGRPTPRCCFPRFARAVGSSVELGCRRGGQDRVALTPEQINAAFRKHIDPAGMTIVKAGDFAAAKVFQ
jgi:zinc protease